MALVGTQDRKVRISENGKWENIIYFIYRMTFTHIKEPFYTAGKKYHWLGKPIGLGIKMSLLEGEGNLEVTVGDSATVYVIDKQEARAFVARYKSVFDAKGTTLGVIAWNMFMIKSNLTNQEKLF